jgi:hypothetical protein
LKKINYCKWHNATFHDTNECKVFRQQIQSAIEQGRLKFETPKTPMEIDGHPFPANMVDVGGKRNVLRTKVLTSQSAKESGAVDLKVQITADEAKGKEPLEKEESVAPKKKVTSRMLLNKFQRDQERRQYREETARRHEGHWRCPFFVYCWEEGLTLPAEDNCPECNGFYRGD